MLPTTYLMLRCKDGLKRCMQYVKYLIILNETLYFNK